MLRYPVRGCALFFEPCGRRYGDENRNDLQSSEQHRGGKHELGNIGIFCVTQGRTDRAEAGTDVIETGNDGGEIGFEIKRLQTQKQKTEEDHEKVQRHIGGQTFQCCPLNGLALKMYDADRTRMQHPRKILPCTARCNDDTRNLHAAAGRACTGTDDHQQEQDAFGQLRPKVKIRCGISGCCHNGCNLKGGMTEGFAEAAVGGQNIAGDDCSCRGDDAEIAPKLG